MIDRTEDDILDDLFHGCAFAAYVELTIACRGVPDMDATRRLAYRFYEEALAERHGWDQMVNEPLTRQGAYWLDEQQGKAW